LAWVIVLVSFVFGTSGCTEALKSIANAVPASARLSPPDVTSTIAVNDMEVSGRVIRVDKKLPSGEPYPPNLHDAPAVFEITVMAHEPDGSRVVRIITYRGYPPGPAGDAQRERVRLRFHEGTIKVGHHIKARGTFEPQINTIRVGEQGDFIETSS
jgi:hypothetical protein